MWIALISIQKLKGSTSSTYLIQTRRGSTHLNERVLPVQPILSESDCRHLRMWPRLGLLFGIPPEPPQILLEEAEVGSMESYQVASREWAEWAHGCRFQNGRGGIVRRISGLKAATLRDFPMSFQNGLAERPF